MFARPSLIVPYWTMGVVTPAQLWPVLDAGARCVGIAGVYGGMFDAFHDSVDWYFMTGGQWVDHPGGQHVNYRVHLKTGSARLSKV